MVIAIPDLILVKSARIWPTICLRMHVARRRAKLTILQLAEAFLIPAVALLRVTVILLVAIMILLIAAVTLLRITATLLIAAVALFTPILL